LLLTADVRRLYFESVQIGVSFIRRVIQVRHLPGFLLVLLVAAAPPTAAIEVAATADRSRLRVGEAVTITVHATRADTLSEPPPLQALLNVGAEWRRAGQSVVSSPGQSSATKSWEFQLVAVTPGKTQIFPAIVTADPSGQPGATLPINGAPVAIEILPESHIARWLLAAVSLLAAGAGVYRAVRVFRRRARRRLRHELPPPLVEALGMMDEIMANCREDRAVRFLTDLERVIHGYLSRRLGQSLAGATTGEIVGLASRVIVDRDLLAALDDLLRRCGTIKYAGWRGTYADLESAARQTRETLERLDRAWVTSDSPSAHSADSGK